MNNKPFISFSPELDFSEILTNPILDIAARVWEKDRYEAFQVCYRSMRVVDDLVDDRKAFGCGLTEPEIQQYRSVIENWTQALVSGRTVDNFQSSLLETIRRFHIPVWPWEGLARAMTYDLSHNGFPTFHIFLRYAEGAAIGPASIFIHLCGVQKVENKYIPPSFDLRRAARTLAIFSYLVHILRDFQVDQLHNLNYFPDSMLADYRLEVAELKAVAEGAAIPDSFRELVVKYVNLIEYYRAKARISIDTLLPSLGPRYRLSLELIYSLYLQIFEKIDPQRSNFTKEEMNPSQDEVLARIEQTISSFKSTN